MSFAVVITTIQGPTPGVVAISNGVAKTDSELILVGDRKTPSNFGHGSATALSVDDQLATDYAIARAVPLNSYTRKMVGYLVAMERGHDWIRETDDDNQPYGSFFEDPPETIFARQAARQEWINPYAFFTDRFVWPRGFPLDAVRDSFDIRTDGQTDVTAPVLVQALADGDPDVDAVYRLTAPDVGSIKFDQREPVVLGPTSWAPFNSQVTTWPKELFPLMYLPATCSFRMTDIWRSFIAQRLMRDRGGRLVFTAPSVFQDRNEHDLMRDFGDEIEGYVGYRTFVNILDSLETTANAPLSDGLRAAYRALTQAGFFTEAETPILEAWLSDVAALGMDY